MASEYQLHVNSHPFMAQPGADVTSHGNKHSKRIVHRSDGRSKIKYAEGTILHRLWKRKDFFNTMLDAGWYFIIPFFCLVYAISWVGFAGVWYSAEKLSNAWFNKTCVSGGGTMPAMILFSIETQVTIGYGGKFVHSDCWIGIIVLVVQCLIGLLLDSVLTGLIFLKIIRPRQRRKSILFSNNAVIRVVDGKRVLEMRIYNLRRSQLVEAHVRLYLYWYGKNTDGDEYDLNCHDLDVGYESGEDRVLFVAPVVVRHHITESGPFMKYNLISDSEFEKRFEIVVVLEAIVESTGLTAQALWSYTESEILFNYRFLPMVSSIPSTGEWVIDHKKINDSRKISQGNEENIN